MNATKVMRFALSLCGWRQTLGDVLAVKFVDFAIANPPCLNWDIPLRTTARVVFHRLADQRQLRVLSSRAYCYHRAQARQANVTATSDSLRAG